MIINSKNWEDVKRYYNHTYIKLKETGDQIWYVKSVEPNMIYLQASNGEDAGLDLNIGYEIEYVIPGRAAFQYGNNALALVRIPSKQYYRGLHPENTSFRQLSGTGRWLARTINFDTIQGFVNKPIYYSISDILNLHQQENFESFALSPNICLASNGVIITTSGNIIGKVMFKSKKISCNKLFIPELTELKLFKHFKPTKEPSKAPEVEEEIVW